MTLERTMVRNEQGGRVTASERIRRPGVGLESLIASGELVLDLDEATRPLDIASLENDVKYAGYLKRERASAEKTRTAGAQACAVRFRFHARPWTVDGGSAEVHAGTSRDPRTGLSNFRSDTGGCRGTRCVS